jgi:hypothetical protein
MNENIILIMRWRIKGKGKKREEKGVYNTKRNYIFRFGTS